MERPKKIVEENKDIMAPPDWKPEMRLEAYRDMAKHVSPTGLVRAIGVCNFSLRYHQLGHFSYRCTRHQIR
jgi:diketogulonate reductase-like aldo/keto reductase